MNCPHISTKRLFCAEKASAVFWSLVSMSLCDVVSSSCDFVRPSTCDLSAATAVKSAGSPEPPASLELSSLSVPSTKSSSAVNVKVVLESSEESFRTTLSHS